MIALDANGADGGPATVAEGGRRSGVPVRIYGPAAELQEFDGVVDSPIAIGNDEEPARAVRAKPEASIARAAQAVASGEADALVSAGPTGAVLAASLFHMKRIRGVYRPAVALLLPIPGRPVLLLDVGANIEVRPEHLVQFAYMGSAFMEAVHGVERPEVGLLSVGEEPGKGTEDVVEAHDRLAGGPLNFVGNVEGNDVTGGVVDVVVTDGFTGNVTLKAIEGTLKTIVDAIRSAIRSGTVSSLGGLLIRGRLGALRHELDPETVAGAILLGVRGVAVVAHGRFSEVGIANAVRVAQRAVDERVVERMTAALEEGGALRSAAAASVGSES